MIFMKAKNHLFRLRSALRLSATAVFFANLAPAQTTIPATWSYPSTDADSESPGFFGSIHQARFTSGLTATIARGNAQLRDELIDPFSLEPFVNLAVNTDNPDVDGDWPGINPINPDGTFTQDGMLNYSADNFGEALDEGNFTSFEGATYLDDFFPGLPGEAEEGDGFYDNGSNFSVEFMTWLDLPAGEIILGVRHDDAMELAFHANDGRDIFRTQVLGFDSNSGFADRTVTLNVEAAGLYPVRVLLAQWNGSTALEFYSAPADDPFNLTLVNDPDIPESVKAWRALTTATRPYATAVTPQSNATGVAPATTISATIENLGSEIPVMRVNGSQVTFDTAVEGETSTLTHTPGTPFSTGESVMVELDYGNTTSTWSFTTQTGRKALLVTGGGGLNSADGWISSRLASQFGFDVTVASDGLVTIDDAEGVDLVFNSSTVNSGLVADVDFETLPIPLINVESFNVDDFKLTDAPYAGKFSNDPTSDTIVITNAGHPMAGGLPEGENIFLTSPVQFHKAVVPANGILIATPVTATDNGVIYGIEAETTVVDTNLSDFTHPARRVFFGLTGNDGASKYNDGGVSLFDAAVTWALAPPTGNAPIITSFARNPDGSVTLTWTSRVDGEYTVFTNDKLDTPVETWPDEDDSILSEGAVTTYTTGQKYLDGKRFFAVKQN